MAKLIRTPNGRWFTSSFFFFVALATFFFALSNPSAQVTALPSARAPIYTAGNFTFGQTKQLLPGAPVLGFQDVEPEIKIDLFGNIYVTAIEGVPAGVDLWKSIDQGANFVYLGQPDGAQCPTGQNCTNDAGLGGGDDSIDVSTGGYLYVSSLWLGSVTMSASYDGATGGVVPGQKWEVNPVAAAIPSDDRQWVAAYGPQTVYMSYRQILAAGANASNVIFVAKSTDAGKTFPQQVATFDPMSDVTARREGNLAVDPYNGNLYTCFRPQELNGHTRAEMWLLKSTDGGSTWGKSKIYQGPAGSDIGNIFPVMAVDRGGNVHLAFSQCDYNSTTQNSSNCGVYLMSSGDQGNTWLAPVKVNNGADTSYAIFPWIVAGSSGVVDITWYGANITNSTQSASWHLYFSQATNAMTDSPAFSQVQAIPQVVHNQDICLKGGACGGNRDLAEYYMITLDPQGNANIAFSDDVTSNTSGLGRTWFTKQTAGPSAYTPPAAPAPATFAPNLVMPGSSGDAEPNMRADTHNCLYSGAPGAPDAWKSTDAGGSFFKLPNPVVSAGGIAGGGDSEIVTLPKSDGTRPDQVYYADLAVASVNISKSTDGGATWFAPGMNGAAGEVSVVTDRQWMAGDRNGANQTVYLWEHEFVGQELRMNSLTNDTVWAPFASGMTDPELIAPPGSTLANTVPGPVFVDSATHQVYGFLGASTVTTNVVGTGVGKLPNVWEAVGAGTFTSGVPPGPFTNYPVFKGVIDSPTNPAPPAGSATVGSNTANLFNGATIDSAGNIYAAWSTPGARNGLYDVWFASSHDHGQTFYGPFKINPSGVQGNMPWIAAGDNGRVDIVYYGTTGTEDPTTSSTNQWNVFFAQSLNAADRDPVFAVSQASDHIMHVGPICNVGILCGGGTRQLLDFFQVAIGPDGLANIAYSDTGSGNGTPHVSYARQSSGPLALSNPSSVTCIPIPVLTGVVSRKTHTGLTPPGDLPLALTGTPTIEPRSGGIPSGNHTLVFTFANPLTSVSGNTTTATTSSGTSSVTCSGSITSPTQYTLNCTGVPNASHLNVTLNGVSDNAPSTGNIGPIHMDVLFGDVSASGRTDAGDVTQVRNRTVSIPDTTSPASFRYDVNISGRIDAGDVTATRNATVTVLP